MRQDFVALTDEYNHVMSVRVDCVQAVQPRSLGGCLIWLIGTSKPISISEDYYNLMHLLSEKIVLDNTLQESK